MGFNMRRPLKRPSLTSGIGMRVFQQVPADRASALLVHAPRHPAAQWNAVQLKVVYASYSSMMCGTCLLPSSHFRYKHMLER